VIGARLRLQPRLNRHRSCSPPTISPLIIVQASA
jgi:hypothetical protein